MTLDTQLSDICFEDSDVTVGDLVNFLKDYFIRSFATEEEAENNPDIKEYIIGDQLRLKKQTILNADLSIPALQGENKQLLAVGVDSILTSGGDVQNP